MSGRPRAERTITDPAVLNRNLAALAARGVVLPEAASGDPQVRLEAGPVDAVLSLCTADGRWVRLHSQHDPATEADRQIAPAFETNEPALVIVIGLGLGYMLDAVERRSPRTKVLALEPVPASLRHMLSRRDWSAWLMENRLRLLVGPDYAGASDAWQEFDSDASMPTIVTHPVLTREARASVVRAREVVERIAFGAQANRHARKQFAGRYLLNTLKNLPVIAREGNAGGLFDAFEGVPAIIASAGPSLDRNLTDLFECHDRAMLIAVDTALRPLLGAGIDPHLAVAVDPSERNAHHLTNLPEPGRTWLVAEGSMDPAVFQQFEGRTFIFHVSNHHPWPWLRGLGLDRGTLRAWGSVATSAFDLALKMGCDPIIFAGQDLAYTDGRPYCRGTTYEEAWAVQVAVGEDLPAIWARAIAQGKAQSVDDINGRRVATMPQLVAFRDWIVEQTAVLDRRTVINATGAGILHGAGIRQADLGSVLISLPRVRGLEDRVREHWGGAASAPAVANRTDPRLLEALGKAMRGEALTTWASFASMTPSDLATELDGVAVAVQPRQSLASPRVDPHRRRVVHAPEVIRAVQAVLFDELVPDWARSAAATIDPRDTSAFRKTLDGLPPKLLQDFAYRCEAAGAYSHAAFLFSRLADRLKRDQQPRPIRDATFSSMRCLFLAGSLEQARDLCDALLLDEASSAVQYLASLYQFVDEDARAVAKLERLVAAYPDLPDVRLYLAVRVAMCGRLADALELIDADATRWPGRPMTEYYRGVCLRFHGDYEAAIRTLAAIVEQWTYVTPELVLASVAAQQPAAVERALGMVRRTFPPPVVFMTVPDSQAAVVDEALALIAAELTREYHRFDVSRVSPIGVRLFTQPANAWTPTWPY